MQLDDADDCAPNDTDQQRVDEVGPEPGPDIDPIELALADALHQASVAGAWTTAERLASEHEARRKERAKSAGSPEVVNLESARRKGGAT